MDSILETLKTLILEHAFSVIGVLVFLFVANLVSHWAARLTRRAMDRRGVDKALVKFLPKLVRILILIMSVIGALGVFGVETTSFAAVLASAGLAIGLAFQGSLSNFAAGVMLLIFRPFKVGDVVKVAGEIGTVDAIDVFTTTMDTADNRRIIIPNGAVFGSVIENRTFHDKRRVDVPVGIDYGADLDKAREVLEEAARAVPGRLEDEPIQVILLSLGGSSVDWQVRVWAKTSEYWGVLDAGTRQVKQALDAAGIGIPFPQLDVHLDK